jgi:hypothetical protein
MDNSGFQGIGGVEAHKAALVADERDSGDAFDAVTSAQGAVAQSDEDNGNVAGFPPSIRFAGGAIHVGTYPIECCL